MGLTLLIPAGSITYPNAGTAIDLVWGNNEAARKLLKCRIAIDHDQGSDHLPIETTLAMRIEAPQTEVQYDYTKTKWKEFDSKLTALLQSPSLAATPSIPQRLRHVYRTAHKRDHKSNTGHNPTQKTVPTQ